MLIDELIKRGIKIQFIRENLVFTSDNSPMSNLLLSVIGAVAEFEREITLERIREGIQQAKKAGKYKGRKSCMNPEKLNWLREQLKTRRSISDLAREAKVSRGSIYKYIKKEKLLE